MSPHVCTWFTVCLFALLPSCGARDEIRMGSDPPVADLEAPIRTDSAVYHVRTTPYTYELAIGVTYSNATGKPVFIPSCHGPTPPVLEKWEEGRWVRAYDPPVELCLGPPVVIEAGQVYAYTYNIHAARLPNAIPKFEVAEIPGTYRLRWRLLGTWAPDGPEPGLGEELALEHSISNTFRISK